MLPTATNSVLLESGKHIELLESSKLMWIEVEPGRGVGAVLESRERDADTVTSGMWTW
ncbi:hypothetical protein GCM10009540_87260 [Streptomyces turgidiscabies]